MREVASQLGNIQKELQKAPEKPGYQLPFVAVSGNSEPYSADQILYRAAIIRPTIYFRRLIVAVYVTGANDGSNYWSIRLRRASGGIASADTSAISAGGWESLSTTAFVPASVLMSADAMVYIDILKTGGPGTLMLAPSVYVI